MLVSVGAALFTLVSAYAWTDFHFSRTSGVTYDPTRIAAQVVTGIGFLGAGAIIRQGLSIRGLTTAATLWIVAAIGMACGAGYYWAAVAATLLALISLWPLRVVSRRVLDRPHQRQLMIQLRAGQPSAPVLATLEELGLGVDSFAIAEEDDHRRLDTVVELPHGAHPQDVLLRLGELEEVARVRWGR
jgi:putative Mg2+ transporter-C (MgtC) family protein